MQNLYVITQYDFEKYKSGEISENLEEIIEKIIKQLPNPVREEAGELKIELKKSGSIEEYTDTLELGFKDASTELKKALNEVFRFITIYKQ